MDAAGRIAQLEAELAAKDAIIEAQRQQIEKLEQMVAQLTRQVSALIAAAGRNSISSHLPPSSDGPGARPAGGIGGGKRNKSARKRGGQPGHAGNKRDMLPPEQVNEIIDLYPQTCGNCQQALLEVPDPHAVRRQVTDIPPIEPHTKEFRSHAVRCGCGHVTRAETFSPSAS